MNILHILKTEPDMAVSAIIEAHRLEHDVTVIDLRQIKDYGAVVDLIADYDKVISW
jgi:hypothetical protein